MIQLLILDDSPSILESLSDTLSDQGYVTHTALTPEKGISILHEQSIDLVITDICFDNSTKDGIWCVREIKKQFPHLPCLAMSGESDVYKVLDCIKEGALDFIVKPISLPRLTVALTNALKLTNTKKQLQNKSMILGQSNSTKQLRVTISRYAQLNENILITGESGTGKELVAENIHLYSNRYEHPFLKINCAALHADLVEAELFGYAKGSFTGAETDKKGYFESASEGTLFLDEIGDLPLETQSKLLRVLQENKVVRIGETHERPIRTRIICATHRPLETMIDEGTFREDLYFRIATFRIHISPLRERVEDIDELAPYLLEQFLKHNHLPEKVFSDSSIQKLKSFAYKGNIRELSSIIKNAAMLCEKDVINAPNIQEHFSRPTKDFLSQTQNMTLSDAKFFLEKSFLEHRLQCHQFNLDETAKSLGIEKTNLYRKLKHMQISLS